MAVWLASCSADPDELMASARAKLAADDTAAALIEVKNLLKDQPESAAGRFMLAKVLLASGDLSGAETELDRARAFKHPDDELLPLQAELLFTQGKHEQLIAQADKASPSSPSAAASFKTWVARAHQARGNLDQAELWVIEALASHADDVPAAVLRARLAAGRDDASTTQRMATALAAAHPRHPEVLLLQADLLAQRQDTLGDAITLYRRVLEIRPKLPEAHARLINALLWKGDMAGARAQVDAASNAMPHSAIPVFYAAVIAHMQQDHQRVRELSQRLMRGAQVQAPVLFMAGVAELRLGALAQAETLLTRAVQAMPAAPEPRRELAVLYLRLARPESALEVIKRPLDQGSADGGIWRVAGQAYASMGDFRRADSAFAHASKLRPKDPQTQVAVARALIARGQVEPGLVALEQAAGSDVSGDADLALVSELMRRGQTQRALKVVDDLSLKRADQALPHLLQGRILLALRDARGAAKAFETARAKAGGELPALAGLAEIDMAEGRAEVARKRYLDLLERDPRSTVAMLALAQISRRSGEAPAVSREWIDKAVQVNPQDGATWRTAIGFHRQAEDNVGALSRARSALAALPDNPELLLVAADAQLAARDLQQAISSLNRVVQLLPQSAEGFARLAQAHLAAGRLATAEQHASRAVELAPASLSALRTAVAVAVRAQQPDKAARIVRGVHARLPDSALGWRIEGETAVALQQWRAAVAAFRRSLAKSDDAQVSIQLHDALLSVPSPSEAKDFERDWLKRRPEDVLFIVHLAESASRRGDWSAAESRYRQALAVKPDDPAILNNLAWTLVQKKDPAALEVAIKAARSLPYLAPVADTVAHAYAQANQLGKAVEWQSRAVELAPQVQIYRLQLARLLLRSGEKGKAREELQRLEQIGLGGIEPAEIERMKSEAGA